MDTGVDSAGRSCCGNAILVTCHSTNADQTALIGIITLGQRTWSKWTAGLPAAL